MIQLKKLLVFLFVVSVFDGHSQPDTVQKIVPGRINDPLQQNKPYVILISIDGFRADYAKKYGAVNLLRLAQQGTTAEYMLASYPSLTFPNHYTLVTGLYPSHHGLVDNVFYDNNRNTIYDMHDKQKAEDGSWYGGVPLWVIAEKKKMLTASFYWVGSDADVQGVRPTYYYAYNEIIPTERRLQVMQSWLALPPEKRPHLITFYFPEVDHAGHDFGPDSPETQAAVLKEDESIGKLVAIAEASHLPVNFIVVSDHGMATADTDHPVLLPTQLRDTALCRISTGSTLVHVYLKDKKNISSLYNTLKTQAADFDVYKSDDMPPVWHYNKKEDRFGRIGDLILVPHFPKVFKTGNRPITPGKHGFDPALPEMHATFIAWGPQISDSKVVKPFENVNVFPLIAKILELPFDHPIDGKLNVLESVLK